MRFEGNNKEDSDQENRFIFLFFLILIAIPCGLQLMGYEVTGGDPDRFFRPLKAEMVRNISNWKLPLWSDLFGFGMPLAAQSEVGAFYVPHYFIYGTFGTEAGYRVSMVVHQLLAAFFIWKLSGRFGADQLGRMIAIMIYLYGGFPTIQASKEWAILGMAWLPCAFLGTEIWLHDRDRKGLILLSLSLASLALIGHFQMAQITSLGLFFWVMSRITGRPKLVSACPGLVLAIVTAIFIASPQLALSWDYARSVGATDRSFSTLAYYSYPIISFLEFFFPLWTRTLVGGPEGAYWTLHSTTQFEACQFVGSCGLVFSVIGLFRKDFRKESMSLFGLAFISILLSTMPQWSESGYAAILKFPGMGLFRCPGRYGILLHFSLAILAAIGVGEKLTKAPMVIIIALFIFSLYQLFRISGIEYFISGMRIKLSFHLTETLAEGCILFVIAMFLTTRKLKVSRFWQVALLTIIFCEMSYFYLSGPTRWGQSIDVIHTSRLLGKLAPARETYSLSGPVDNLPVSIGVRTTAAYFGVNMPSANELAKAIVEQAVQLDRQGRHGDYDNYLRKIGATHQLQLASGPGAELFPNDSLSGVIAPLQGRIQNLYLRKIEGTENAINLFNGEIQSAANEKDAFNQWLTQSNEKNNLIMTHKTFNDFKHILSKPLDREASVASAEESDRVRVSHRGSFILCLRKTFDKGWKARAKDNQEVTIFPINGGQTAVLVTSNEKTPTTSEIEFYYWPDSLNLTLPIAVSGLIFMMYLGVPLKSYRIRKQSISVPG